MEARHHVQFTPRSVSQVGHTNTVRTVPIVLPDFQRGNTGRIQNKAIEKAIRDELLDAYALRNHWHPVRSVAHSVPRQSTTNWVDTAIEDLDNISSARCVDYDNQGNINTVRLSVDSQKPTVRDDVKELYKRCDRVPDIVQQGADTVDFSFSTVVELVQ